MSLHIENKTQARIPQVPFKEIFDLTLGQDYELSLVFVGSKLSKEFNRCYRGKNKSTNILSFPLEKNEGEIILDIKLIRDEATRLEVKKASYLAYVFIHGLIHLKGFEHGSKMEEEERQIREKFSEKQHSNRHRYRILFHKDCSF